MNYRNIYYKIIEKAKKEIKNGNRHIGYYEKHHIIPKSLGGTNEKENLVKLTAREHFICHWLLVKMYEKGTVERYKMLCALWRMNHNGSKNHGIHYINSRAYEALRIEFAKTIGKITSKNQQGNKNSQFGTKWYTNRNTGESKKFKEKPLELFWIEGRNLFHGESSKIGIKYDIMKKAKYHWDKFHSGNYKSIRDYARQNNIPAQTVTNNLRIIPLFKNVFKGRSHDNGSKKQYVGIYEE